MKKTCIKILALLLVCIALFSLVGCGGGGETATGGEGSSSSAKADSGKKADKKADKEEAKDDGPKVLNASVTGDDGTLSIVHATGTLRPALLTIFEALWDVDNDNNVTMKLCESIETISDVEMYIHLKQGIKFNNGNDFKANDVVFTMKMYNALGGLAAAKVQTVDTEKTKVIDDYTVDLILLNPTIVNTTVLASCWMYDEESYSDANAAVNPVGTGPFMAEDYIPGSSLTLVRNENYWGEKPYLDQINIKILAEAAQRVNALESGDIDVTTIATTDYDYVSGLKGIEVYDFYSGSYQIMNLNFSPTSCFWQNPDARKAVCHAINREAILNTVYNGFGRVMTAAMPEYMIDFEERFKNLDDTYSIGYDPELAAQLAKSSGLVNKTVRLVTNGTETCIKQTEMIQAMLKEIGVNSEIFNYDNATYIGLLRGIDNPWDIMVSSGASPNRRTGDLLVNSVKSRQDILMEGSVEGNDTYLEKAIPCMSLQDPEELSDQLYEVLKIYEDQVLSYGVVDTKTFIAYSDKIDPDSIVFPFGSSSPRYAELKFK